MKWVDDGEFIILVEDINEYVWHGELVVALASLGITEAISIRYKKQQLVPTFQTGSNLIDGIFTSTGVNIVEGGYLLFGEAMSDYRAIWVKLSIE